MTQIRLTNVGKKYPGKGDNFAVRGISYTVEDREFVSLLGPSGCGKSTTLNMIAGLESVTEGTIEIDGRRVETLEPHKRDLAFVFQDYALYPHLNVYDNIAFGLKMRKLPKSEIHDRVMAAARQLELEDFLRKKPRALSGGQRQRVALSRAIARRPAVLLFDEPLSNLDALLRDKTRAELKILHREINATSIYVTHDQEEAMSLSSRIAVMSHGRLEQYGTPEQIYSEPATSFVAGFVGKPHMNLLHADRVERNRYQVTGSRLVVDLCLREQHDHILLGLRPSEVCALRADDKTTSIGNVSIVEPLGSHSDIIIDLGQGNLFVTRENGFPELRVGDPVRLDLRSATRHAFDYDTGVRIE